MKLLVPFLIILLTTIPAAAELSIDTSQGKTSGRDKAMSLKKSIENKVSKLNSTGSDSTSSRADRRSGNINSGGGLELSIPARALIPEDIQYKLPVDFSLAARESGGWVNVTLQDYIAQQAKSGGLVSNVAGAQGEKNLREYLLAMATFGAKAAQAQILLNDWAGKIGNVKRAKNGEIEVRGLGADDLFTLAAGAWQKADKITDTRILSDLDTMREDQTPCRLSGDPTTVQCGATIIHLTTPPSLHFRDVEWYGRSFAGINATYKISSSWSWQKALESSRSSSVFARKQADDLEAEGNSFDAVMTRKQAVEKGKTNRATMSSGKPGQN